MLRIAFILLFNNKYKFGQINVVSLGLCPGEENLWMKKRLT